jgi:hypothetical protein
MANQIQLENYSIPVKLKLAALWTSVMFLYIYGDYFELYVPDKIESLLSGSNNLNTPVNLFIASIVLAIPSLMISVSLIASPTLSRWLNMIFGIIFTAIMLLIAVTSFSPWRASYVFYAFLESAITLFIFWLAWKWPRQITIPTH